MSIENIMGLVALAALVTLWLHQSRISRHALMSAKRYVREQGMQFLDNSVVLCGLRPGRTAPPGRGLCLHRTYRFEFSVRGDRRYQGRISLVGRKIESITLPPVPELEPEVPRVE